MGKGFTAYVSFEDIPGRNLEIHQDLMDQAADLYEHRPAVEAFFVEIWKALDLELQNRADFGQPTRGKVLARLPAMGELSPAELQAIHEMFLGWAAKESYQVLARFYRSIARGLDGERYRRQLNLP